MIGLVIALAAPVLSIVIPLAVWIAQGCPHVDDDGGPSGR